MSLYSGSKAAVHPIVNAFRVEMPHIAFSTLNIGHVTTEVANAAMPAIAEESGCAILFSCLCVVLLTPFSMPPDVCAQYVVDQMILQEREVFFPATYKPFRFPGIVAFLGAMFVPELMESISQATYGSDFVKATEDTNPLAAAK